METVPTTSHRHWFRGRQTPELLFSYLPETMIPRPTNAGKYSRSTTQRPSTSTTALPVRISSFGNGTPETSNPTHRHKQQPPYSVGSRLFPLTRRVANESSPFGLGISHRTLPLSTSFRPFPTRQNNSAAPPLQRDRFPRSNSVPASFIATQAHLAIPPCPSPPRRDTKEPPCSGLRRPPGGSNRSSPHGRVSSPFDKRWSPTAPFSRLPWPKLSRPCQATNSTSRPAFQCTHQRTQANNDFPSFPNHNKPAIHRSHPSLKLTPH